MPDQLGSAARRGVAVDRAAHAHPCEGRRETDGDGWGERGTGGHVGQPARMPRVNFFLFLAKFNTYFKFDLILKIFSKLVRLAPPLYMAGQVNSTPSYMAAESRCHLAWHLQGPADVAGYVAKCTPPPIMAG